LILILEVGGTVGDIKSQTFLEAIRQFQREIGLRNAIILLVTLVSYLKVAQEVKAKPTQSSIRELQSFDLFPDILICRSEVVLDDAVRTKIGLTCSFPKSHLLQNFDLEHPYEPPLALEEDGLAQAVCECSPIDVRQWKGVVAALRSPLAQPRQFLPNDGAHDIAGAPVASEALPV
jgi:CTP synthase